MVVIECEHCGISHKGTCPRIKAKEFHPDGSVKRIEFHPPAPVKGVYDDCDFVTSNIDRIRSLSGRS